MLKKIAIALVVLIIIAGGGLFYLRSNLDSLVRTAVEKYGSAATQTTVKLDKVKIVIVSGEASLGGLSVGVPAGFSSPKSLYLGEIAVKIDPQSIRGNGPIIIKDVLIDKPQITYEVNNAGENNLQALAKNAEAYASSLAGASGDAPKADDAGAAKKPARKVIINGLTIKDGQIGISQELLKGKVLSATLPTIHLTNIGKGEGGATPAEVANQLLGVITTSASKIASADLAKELGGQALDAAKGAAGSALDAVGGHVKGLFGN